MIPSCHVHDLLIFEGILNQSVPANYSTNIGTPAQFAQDLISGVSAANSA